MNKALEIHDSTLNEIKKNDLSIILCLGKAIIHHSEGEPGIDKGTCWLQSIEIYLENVKIINEPDDIPNELDYGYFIINGTKYDNMIKVPFKESGELKSCLKHFLAMNYESMLEKYQYLKSIDLNIFKTLNEKLHNQSFQRTRKQRGLLNSTLMFKKKKIIMNRTNDDKST